MLYYIEGENTKGSDLIKRVVNIFLVIIIASQFLIVTSSATIPISPFYINIYSCSSDLTISGSTATCESIAKGYLDITKKILIEQYLEKKSGNSWTGESSWSSTVNYYSGSATNTKSSLASGTYRLRTVFTINDSETITVISAEKTK